jgi:hypothetical protein
MCAGECVMRTDSGDDNSGDSDDSGAVSNDSGDSDDSGSGDCW